MEARKTSRLFQSCILAAPDAVVYIKKEPVKLVRKCTSQNPYLNFVNQDRWIRGPNGTLVAGKERSRRESKCDSLPIQNKGGQPNR